MLADESRSVIAHESEDVVIKVCQLAREDMYSDLEAMLQRSSIGCRPGPVSKVAIKGHIDVEVWDAPFVRIHLYHTYIICCTPFIGIYGSSI